MSKAFCDRESETLKAVRLEPGHPALQAHAAHCDVCRETLEVAAWVRKLSDTPVEAPPLRDASYMWWKLELARQLNAPQRAAEPVDFADRVLAGVCLAGIIAVFLSARSELWSGQYWLFGVDVIALAAVLGPLALLCAASLTAWKLFGRG